MESKYHKQVYFQEGMEDYIRFLLAGMTFYPSKHFLTNSIRRKLPFPTKTSLMNAEIFEYTTYNGKLEKFCVRCALTDALHYCYSINIRGNVITGWKNKAEDNHFTLQEGKYVENKKSETGIKSS